jgi:processive 1,2-diacylglycerol beta-glucosyltransferase
MEAPGLFKLSRGLLHMTSPGQLISVFNHHRHPCYDTSMIDQPRILILSTGAGQGHNRAAQALEAAAQKIVPEGTVRRLDSLDYTTESFRAIYSKYYIETVKNAPTLWGWAFQQTDVPWRAQALREWFERINAQPLVREILEFEADFVINTHSVPAAVTSHLLRRGKIRAHNSVVVTDFYAHASWLVRQFHRYFVAHEEERRQLMAYGIPGERISVTGIPVAPEFSEKKDPAVLRRELGLDPELPMVLLAAGAFGVVPVQEMLSPLLEVPAKYQITVLCGRNKKLKKTVESFLEGRTEEFPRFTVLGYTEKIHRWMGAADLFITKPGGLSSAESLAMGLPMVLTDPIPGQEVSNAMYLLEHGAAVIPTSTSTIGYKVEKLLTRPDSLERIKTAAGRLGRPAAAETILKTLLSCAGDGFVSLEKPEE